jgi:1,4-dihydroxy-2-naphthoate octaprenyltransferase
VNEIPDRRSDAQAGKRTLPTRFSPARIRGGYLVMGLAAFGIIAAGVLAGLLPWPTLIALAAVPILFHVHAGLVAFYDSPYALMAVMGQNVNLNLVVGGLLVAAYVVTIVAAQLA